MHRRTEYCITRIHRTTQPPTMLVTTTIGETILSRPTLVGLTQNTTPTIRQNTHKTIANAIKNVSISDSLKAVQHRQINIQFI